VKKIISKTVWILGFVSLFNDISSEMVIPVMPIFLKSIGFSALLIGLLEGFAEATAGLSKGYFGYLSDKYNTRKPFVSSGYFLSTLSKPMLAISALPFWIFVARFFDRFGKGIRTAARDAILSEQATAQTKGRIFGFHKGMDTTGAVIGPLISLVLLTFYDVSYQTIFLIAFAPSLIGFLLTLFVKEEKSEHKVKKSIPGFFTFIKYWKEASPSYKKAVVGFLAFGIINSSDLFLLLMIKNITNSDQDVLMVYIFYNIVFAATSYPMGAFADKIGFKKSYVIGLIVFAIVYGVMATSPSLYVIYGLFFLYGLYASLNESVSKAWIASIVHTKIATALGFFTGFNSVCLLIASTVAGLIWTAFEAPVMFAYAGTGALVVAIYLMITFKGQSFKSNVEVVPETEG
jgi:MFS family permease